MLEDGPISINTEFAKRVRYEYKIVLKFTDKFLVGAVEPTVCWFARQCYEDSMTRAILFALPHGKSDIETSLYQKQDSSAKYLNFVAVLETSENVTAKQANKNIDNCYFGNPFYRATQKHEILEFVHELKCY